MGGGAPGQGVPGNLAAPTSPAGTASPASGTTAGSSFQPLASSQVNAWGQAGQTAQNDTPNMNPAGPSTLPAWMGGGMPMDRTSPSQRPGFGWMGGSWSGFRPGAPSSGSGNPIFGGQQGGPYGHTPYDREAGKTNWGFDDARPQYWSDQIYHPYGMPNDPIPTNTPITGPNAGIPQVWDPNHGWINQSAVPGWTDQIGGKTFGSTYPASYQRSYLGANGQQIFSDPRYGSPSNYQVPGMPGGGMTTLPPMGGMGGGMGGMGGGYGGYGGMGGSYTGGTSGYYGAPSSPSPGFPGGQPTWWNAGGGNPTAYSAPNINTQDPAWRAQQEQFNDPALQAKFMSALGGGWTPPGGAPGPMSGGSLDTNPMAGQSNLGFPGGFDANYGGAVPGGGASYVSQTAGGGVGNFGAAPDASYGAAPAYAGGAQSVTPGMAGTGSPGGAYGARPADYDRLNQMFGGNYWNMGGASRNPQSANDLSRWQAFAQGNDMADYTRWLGYNNGQPGGAQRIDQFFGAQAGGAERAAQAEAQRQEMLRSGR